MRVFWVVLGFVIGLLFWTLGQTALAQSTRGYVSGSIQYMQPSAALADSARMKPGMQFDVRYTLAPSRLWSIGIGGTWMTSRLGDNTNAGETASSLSITSITTTLTLRLFKHGWSPICGFEGGFGYLIPPDAQVDRAYFRSTLGAVYGAFVGVTIPVSDRLDVAASARMHRVAVSTPLDLSSASIGLVYRIQ